jgi:hypothetical protein
MPGAIIVASQTTGAGAGTPGVSRSDLWVSQAVQLSVGVGGNTSYLWELVAKPPGSASTISGSTAATAGFTPDTVGTYRVRLTTNGGGPGNVQTLALRVRYSSSGVLVSRGWVLPGYGERSGEDNAGGNTRGYAPLLEGILSGLESELNAIGSLPAVIDALKYREIPLCTSEQSTLEEGYVVAGHIYLNLAKYPAAIGALTRTFRFQAIMSASGAVGNDLVAWVTRARLYNVTHGYEVTGSVLTASPSGDVSLPKASLSGTLTVGSGSGHIRSDTPAVYAVEFLAWGDGVLASPDHVTLHGASVVLEYV